jgi:hypothetical protein
MTTSTTVENGSTESSSTDSSSTMTTNTNVGKINVAAQRATVLAQYTALVTGINTQLTDVSVFTFQEQQIPKTQVVSRLQARIDAAQTTKVARLALGAAVAAEAQIVADTTPLVADLKTFLQSRLGKKSPKLQTFGLTQLKTTQKSVAAKSVGVAKALATRKAIGTKGKKQRKAAIEALAASATVQAPATSPAPAPVTTPPATAPAAGK